MCPSLDEAGLAGDTRREENRKSIVPHPVGKLFPRLTKLTISIKEFYPFIRHIKEHAQK